MGLSRQVTNRGEISTFQLLLDIAQSLSELTKNPKALEQAAKDAFALSDEEEKRALAARADIAKNEALLSEQRKALADVESTLNELNKEKAGIQTTLDNISKEKARLAKVDTDLGKRALDLSVKENDLSRREADLETSKKKLADDTVALNMRIKEHNEAEKSFKEKADKLRSIVGA